MANIIIHEYYSIENTDLEIPDNDLINVYDPFFTTKQPNKETGLGFYAT